MNKALDIAIKDMLRSFRSLFAVAFMFVVPLLMTGIFYLAFGGTSSGEEHSFTIPTTRVQIINLDQGIPDGQMDFSMMNLDQFPVDEDFLFNQAALDNMGDMIVQLLSMDVFSELMQIKEVDQIERAFQAVDGQLIGVAVVIPENFSAAIVEPDGETEIQIYADPDLTIGPGIVEGILRQMIENFASAKIKINTINQRLDNFGLSLNGEQVNSIVQAHITSQIPQSQTSAEENMLLEFEMVHENEETTNNLQNMLRNIMGGMMVFYAFYTGTATAGTILDEEEAGTLQRLFTTPTTHKVIITGKFLAVGLTTLVQIVVLLLLAHWIFGIDWGLFGQQIWLVFGVAVSGSTFGIFIMSLLRSSRQVGMIYGGVLTITGMIGMMRVFVTTPGGVTNFLETASLVVPQGWGMRLLNQISTGASNPDIFFTVGVLLLWSAVFFSIGTYRFNRRFA
jgi:ABC-type multidrug transport system permease subunit